MCYLPRAFWMERGEYYAISPSAAIQHVTRKGGKVKLTGKPDTFFHAFCDVYSANQMTS